MLGQKIINSNEEIFEKIGEALRRARVLYFKEIRELTCEEVDAFLDLIPRFHCWVGSELISLKKVDIGEGDRFFIVDNNYIVKYNKELDIFYVPFIVEESIVDLMKMVQDGEEHIKRLEQDLKSDKEKLEKLIAIKKETF